MSFNNPLGEASMANATNGNALISAFLCAFLTASVMTPGMANAGCGDVQSFETITVTSPFTGKTFRFRKEINTMGTGGIGSAGEKSEFDARMIRRLREEAENARDLSIKLKTIRIETQYSWLTVYIDEGDETVSVPIRGQQ